MFSSFLDPFGLAAFQYLGIGKIIAHWYFHILVYSNKGIHEVEYLVSL